MMLTTPTPLLSGQTGTIHPRSSSMSSSLAAITVVDTSQSLTVVPLTAKVVTSVVQLLLGPGSMSNKDSATGSASLMPLLTASLHSPSLVTPSRSSKLMESTTTHLLLTLWISTPLNVTVSSSRPTNRSPTTGFAPQ